MSIPESSRLNRDELGHTPEPNFQGKLRSGSAAHGLFGRRQCVDESLTAEYPLSVFHQRCSRFRQFDRIVIKTPEERRNRHIQHRKVFTKHVFLLDEDRRHLGQAVADDLTCLVGRLVVLLQRFDMQEHLAFHRNQQLPRARAHDRVGRHQLRMWKTFINILIDDVRLVQDQIAFNEYRHTPIGVDHGDIFLFGEEIDINHLEIHAFFVQDYAATLAERASRARIEIHHDSYLKKRTGIVAAMGAITPLRRRCRNLNRRLPNST
ncbi:conserved hypothetical protein [Candidatus Propionivibrio aalborgensis]|uniref:Uncharacterized protein n=1 Tax=Candidatus Propionivibrio aalborgensis TaxID=1860101 RepID=A0A1A8Y1K5_9RHOO|nr:conserved hypothetical protein [Candidatus Propionivibrio aalborgensis]